MQKTVNWNIYYESSKNFIYIEKIVNIYDS